MEKEQFKREFKEALKDPKKYFNIRMEVNPQTGKKGLVCDVDKLNDFFQSFSKHYLDSDVAEFTDRFPTVQFEDFSATNRNKFEVGNQNARDNKISLNLGMFLKSGGDPTVFLGFLTTLCHEHHHFRQNLYINLKNQGREKDAEKLALLFSSNSGKEGAPTVEEIESSITQPLTQTSLKAHIIFMKEAMPEKYNKMKSANFLNNIVTRVADKTPVELAYYFHDAHEVDAREQSIGMFKDKYSELTDNDPKLAKKTGFLVWGLEKFNKKVLTIQPKKVLNDFENAKAQIGIEEFIAIAKKIEKEIEQEGIEVNSLRNNGSLSFDHKPKKYEILHETFGIVLSEKLSSLSEEESKKFLESLKNSGSQYIQYVVENMVSEPSIDKPTPSQIAEERNKMDEENKKTEEPQIEVRAQGRSREELKELEEGKDGIQPEQ